MAEERVIKIGMLGLGTVGTGVYKVLKSQQEEMLPKLGARVELKKILVRNVEKAAAKVDDPSIITTSFEEIANDPEIEIVVEVMGGKQPAMNYILACLDAGKNVVTANKDLVASEGKKILATAKRNGKDFLYEASVAGGIPIIRPLNSSMTADEIEEITGILNGTTNYMLSKMFYEGADYEEVLKEAQEKGYAERNPEADVEGYDACRKIAILSSLISGQQVDFEDIYTEGITQITKEDMMYAKAMGMTIKLLACSRRDEDHIHAIVAPYLLSSSHPLYSVNDVFNAIFVHGNVLGDAMFYGSGAGKLPTASAVVSDIVDEVKHLNRNIMTMWDQDKVELLPISDTSKRFFVRIKGEPQAMKAHLESKFGPIEIVQVEPLEGEFGFLTEIMTEGHFEQCQKEFPSILHRIRVEG